MFVFGGAKARVQLCLQVGQSRPGKFSRFSWLTAGALGTFQSRVSALSVVSLTSVLFNGWLSSPTLDTDAASAGRLTGTPFLAPAGHSRGSVAAL